MSSEINKLNINAYLTPHPLDELSDIEPECLDWIQGFNKNTEEDAVYDEQNIELYNLVESIVEGHFRNAMSNLWPLFKKTHIQSLQIAIDYSNLIGTGKYDIASFHYERSRMTEGVYVFTMQAGLLNYYMKRHYENIAPDDVCDLTWEHELIHMADHANILKGALFGSSDVPSENLKHYITKYREEGLAELYYLLKGNKKINSVCLAKEIFLENFQQAKTTLTGIDKTTESIRKELFSGHSFYNTGPWLILDLLRSFRGFYYKDEIETCIENLENNVGLSHDKIINIIKIALEISVEDFWEYGREITTGKNS